MVDRCAYCNVELPDKIKHWASYCNGRLDTKTNNITHN